MRRAYSPRVPRLCRLSLSLLIVLCACDEPGYRIVIRAHADDPDALVAGALVTARVLDRQTRGGSLYTSFRLEHDLGSAEPAVIDLDLNGGGQYDAHLLVSSPAGRWVATRCYQIGGTESSDVLLVGPLDGSIDGDGDGWPGRDDCVDPGGVPCVDPCPPIRANDCNEFDPDIHPGAEDVCQDQIDQDCSGNDALCAEDESGP